MVVLFWVSAAAAFNVTDGDRTIPPADNMEGGGIVTVGTTAVAMTFTATPTRTIVIVSYPTNTGLIFVGKSDVTNLGANAFAVLQSGDSVTLDYDDATNAVYTVSDTADQKVVKGTIY